MEASACARDWVFFFPYFLIDDIVFRKLSLKNLIDRSLRYLLLLLCQMVVDQLQFLVGAIQCLHGLRP